jgi:basic amino acid/polyamine antiporter, APA family
MPVHHPLKRPNLGDAGAPSLQQAIGLRQLTAGICNVTIGAGIYLLPARVGSEIGAASPLAYAVVGVTLVLVTLCFAMAGSRVRASGGPYAYVEAAFGPKWGFIAGFLFCASAILAVGGVARELASMLSSLPLPVGNVPTAGWILLIMAVLACCNIRGVRGGARLVELLTVAKVLPLLAFVLAGITAIRSDNLVWPGWPSGRSFGSALMLVFWAMSGTEMALQPGEEIKEPARTVPQAILIAVPALALFYLAIQVVVQGVLGSDLARWKDKNVLIPAAQAFLGRPGALLLGCGAAVSMLGLLSGDMLGTPRMWLAFARGKFVPRALARVPPRYATPHIAVVVHASLVVLAGVTSSFERLVELSGTMIVVMYLLCCAAAWRLDQRDVRLAGVPFRFPGRLAVPWLAGGFLGWILSQQTAAELCTAAGACALAVIISCRPWAAHRMKRPLPNTLVHDSVEHLGGFQ